MAHDSQKAVRIEACAWSKDAADWLAQAVQPQHLIGLQHQVEQGIATLFSLVLQDELCGAFVLRIDQNGPVSEGVICAAAGELPGYDLTATILPVIESKFSGCSAIRYHTSHPAVARKMAAHGYQADEIVCRKRISNGQQQQ